jgi:hypothetical protein
MKTDTHTFLVKCLCRERLIGHIRALGLMHGSGLSHYINFKDPFFELWISNEDYPKVVRCVLNEVINNFEKKQNDETSEPAPEPQPKMIKLSIKYVDEHLNIKNHEMMIKPGVSHQFTVQGDEIYLNLV